MEISLGKQIEYYRKKAGMTKAAVAKRLGVSPATVTFWEKDAYSPTLFNLRSLAEVLGCEESELLSRYSFELPDKLFEEGHMAWKLRELIEKNGFENSKKALDYARMMHDGQFRKGPGQVPYIYHPMNMACQAFALGIADDTLIPAVLLHDVVEDTEAKLTDLDERHGGNEEIREIVRLVTKEKGYRQKDYFERISHNRYASMVKILDRCSNLSDMTTAFSKEKMAEYVNETEEYIVPLLLVTKYVNADRWYDATYLLNYQIRSMLTAVKALL